MAKACARTPRAGNCSSAASSGATKASRQRRRDPQADRLQGEAWLEFLDRGSKRRDFADGAGRVLLDGAYRREVEPARVAALHDLARRRFLQWMGAGR